MKKMIALLLSASMIMACAACTKETEETKKKKKKKKSTTTTEETTTEEPSESTTTEETTEETTTETATSPGSGVTLDDVLVFDTSLEQILIENYPSQYAYGVLADPDSQYNQYGTVTAVYEDVDDLYVSTSGYDNLEVIFDDVYGYILDKYDTQYEEALEEFLTDIENGILPSPVYIECYSDVTRADSFITSFFVREYDDNYDYIYNVFNVYTETCDQILFTDVVKDPDALCQVVLNCPDLYNAEDYVEDINNGTIAFTMDYDGIIMYCGYSRIKVSAIANQSVFNMGFFGKTPEYYVLHGDFNHEIYWDLDTDGTPERISITGPDYLTDYSDREYIFDINGVTSRMGPDNAHDLEGIIEDVYLARTDEGFVFIVETIIEDDRTLLNTFTMNKDYTVDFQDQLQGYFWMSPYDPNYLQILRGIDLVGSSYGTNTYSLMGLMGTFWYESSLFLRPGSVLVAKTEFDAVDGNGSAFTVDKDTSLRMVGYDIENGVAYFEILYPDGIENQIICMELEGEDWPFKLNGQDERDLFFGLMYGG
ncbi:MAG: hypothetical protein J6Y08_03605 [Clostridiales bacterium]|nr:hypothetical protein [Clostridiales bacterium]